MPTLNEQSNRVLQEFGGRIPANLLQFEDARREFLSVRSLELQKLGVSHKTVESKLLSGNARSGTLSPEMTPSFVEFSYTGTTGVHRVEIVSLDKLPEYESGRAISFYGDRYKTSFDFWNNGAITLWYDPIEDFFNTSGDDDVPFVSSFSTYLVKQAAFNLCGVLMLNLALNAAPEEEEKMKLVVNLLTGFQTTLSMQVAEWKKEFKKHVNAPFGNQPHLRGTNDEILAQGFNNIRRSSPLDYVG
jgi:hypothetical protein